jgi:hypothetical protein
MDTRMHADAMPDADPASLQSPNLVAAIIAAMIEQSNQITSGARLVASQWEVPYETSALTSQ